MLADFDYGKDVRETKLQNISSEKIPEMEINSIKSKNTIKSGTSGYQTPNSFKDRAYDESDEFYALAITLLHLIITFPGDPSNRNHYSTTFTMSDVDDVIFLFDSWTGKYVKNKPKEFNFNFFKNQLTLAKAMMEKKVNTHN